MEQDLERIGRIQDYARRHGALPSYAELARLAGFRSKASAAKFVRRMEAAGFLRRGPGGRLVPGPRFRARPWAGAAPAGFPSPGDEPLEDALSIDEYLVRHPSRTFLVQVRGHSMTGAGILDGDFVVVERAARARPGQIVVARVDGEFTVKYLDRDAEGWVLRPANPRYPEIHPEGELALVGIVVGVFRRCT